MWGWDIHLRSSLSTLYRVWILCYTDIVESVQISKILSILSVSEDYNVPLSLHGNGHVLEPAYSHE